MRPRRTPNSNVAWRQQGQSEDHDLWAEMGEDPDTGQSVIRSVWQLNRMERLRVAAGHNIQLLVWSESQPVVALGTTDQPLGKDGTEALQPLTDFTMLHEKLEFAEAALREIASGSSSFSVVARQALTGLGVE